MPCPPRYTTYGGTAFKREQMFTAVCAQSMDTSSCMRGNVNPATRGPRRVITGHVMTERYAQLSAEAAADPTVALSSSEEPLTSSRGCEKDRMAMAL